MVPELLGEIAGTKLEIEAVFDNSEDNPYNPSRPPKERHQLPALA